MINNSLVSIGIINWNSTKYLNICLESIFRQTYKNIEIIIVDNNSEDEFEEWVKEKNFDNSIKIIQNNRNLGFSKPQNQAIKASSGEFYLSLNPDVILKENFIEEMVNILKKDEKVGSASGKLLRIPREIFERIYVDDKIDENLFKRFIDLKNNELTFEHIIDSTGHIACKDRTFANRGEEKPDYGDYNETEEIFGVCAGCAFYRRNMLEDIKVIDEYFDKDFFAYLEDVDLDWRAQLRGWKCVYTPYAIAYHIRGGTTNTVSEFTKQLAFRNRYLMMLKNDTLAGILKDFYYLFFTEANTLHRIFTEKPFLLKNVFEIIVLIPKILKKRRLIQKNKIVEIDEIEKWFVNPKNTKKLIRRFIIRIAIVLLILYILIRLLKPA